MKVTPTALAGAYIIEPRVFTDQRGYFFESYNKKIFDAEVADVTFVQDNESRSTRGVVRGLHFQRGEHAQAKLVRCTEGAVIDIALDIRPDSPTFGRHIAVELSVENKRQFFVPRGMAHGFIVLSDHATFQYKCDNYYCPQSEGGILITDPELGIELPQCPIFSDKDTKHPTWEEFVKQLKTN